MNSLVEEKSKSLKLKLLSLTKNEDFLRKTNIEGLSRLMDIGIEFEEYEVFGIIKNEIEKRKLIV